MNYKIFDRSHLKIIAFITMMIDHFGLLFCKQDTMLYEILRTVIGRIAFPMFCVLFVEGFLYTKKENRLRHVLMLFIFAIVSEIPYDYCLVGNSLDFSKQNVMWTWLLGFVMLWLMDMCDDLPGFNSIAIFFADVLILGCMTYVAVHIACDYNVCGMSCIWIAYYVKKYLSNIQWRIVCVFVCVILTIGYGSYWCFLAVVPFVLYNGQQGRKMKYLYYVGYPLHIVIFGCIARIFFS